MQNKSEILPANRKKMKGDCNCITNACIFLMASFTIVLLFGRWMSQTAKWINLFSVSKTSYLIILLHEKNRRKIHRPANDCQHLPNRNMNLPNGAKQVLNNPSLQKTNGRWLQFNEKCLPSPNFILWLSWWFLRLKENKFTHLAISDTHLPHSFGN